MPHLCLLLIALPLLLNGCALTALGRSTTRWPTSILISDGDAATPRQFAPGVISRDREFAATFSEAHGQVYVVQRIFPTPVDPPKLTILQSTFAAGSWSAPVPIWFSGQYRDIDPFISPDGRWMLFNSDRPAPGRDSARTDFDIWISGRTSSGWGPPRRLGNAVNTIANESFATISGSGEIYYGSTIGTGTARKRGIVRALPKGGDWAPADTLTGLPEDSGNPTIDPDGRYLIFNATIPGGAGDSDLYVTRRTTAGWATPCPMGPGINTSDAEFAPGFSPDGRLLFFSRIRRETAPFSVLFERIWFVELRAVLPASC